MADTLKLKPGSRLRTGGATYQVTESVAVPAGYVPVEPQATRLLKVQCSKCGYTARITQRWINAGVPDCPTDHVAMVVEDKPAKGVKPSVYDTGDVVKREAVAAPIAEPIDLPVEDCVSDATSELARLLAAEL